MSESFVPFAKAKGRSGPASDAFRLTILPQNAQATAFVPAAPTPPAAPPPTTSPGIGEPQLSVERDGDRITRITITCTCGKQHELNCTY